jgi:hypothetical protein
MRIVSIENHINDIVNLNLDENVEIINLSKTLINNVCIINLHFICKCNLLNCPVEVKTSYVIQNGLSKQIRHDN